MNAPVIILGGGGHASSLMWSLALRGTRILGFTDPREDRTEMCGVRRLGGDDVVFQHRPDAVRLVNGIGSVGSTVFRTRLYERFRERGYSFATVVHPAAVVAPDVMMEEGVQVMAAAVVQPGCRLGANGMLNTKCSIDHGSRLGAHVCVGPGAVLSGDVLVGDGAHIGTGAVIIQGREVGAGSLVGAGAVVVKDVPPGVTVVGVPAEILRRCVHA